MTTRRGFAWILGMLLLTLRPGAPENASTGPTLDLPQRAAGDGWRIDWASRAGSEYTLQRSRDLSSWTNVATVTAQGDTASVLDTGASGATPAFWRVIRIRSGVDTVPPVVSLLQGRLVKAGGNPALELAVRVEDDWRVASVQCLEDGASVGAATVDPDATWRWVLPINLNQATPRRFQARANDEAGNVGFSDVFSFVPEQPAPGVRSIGVDGEPMGQGVVGRRLDGSLMPFVYLPGDEGGASAETHAQFVFPEGGRLVEQNGQTLVEYRSLQFRFGASSPLQVAVPGGTAQNRSLLSRWLAAAQPGAGNLLQDVLSVNLPDGQTGLLPLGAMSVAQLEQAFNLPAGSGIPVKLFDRFPLRLLEGVLDDTGISGAQWGLDELGLPLPPFTGDWADGVFDLVQGKCGRFPVYGEIPLDNFEAGLAKLRTSKEKPLVLELCPSGEISLKGPATLEFENGVRLTVSVILDDPLYRLQVQAENLVVPVAGALALVLPNNPENCLPTGASDADLDAAEVCLQSFRRAYFRFAQAAVAGRPIDAPSLNQPEAPTSAELVTAIADAWAASVFTPIVQALPVDQMRELARNLGRSASGATDFETASDYLRQVVRLKEALNAYAQAQQFGNDPAIPGLQQEIEAALNEATAAAIARSRDPAAISSMASMRSALKILVDIWASRQLLGNDNEAGLQAAVAEVVDRFFRKLTSSLNIQPNVFDHTLNPVVAGMNRFNALDHAVTLFDLAGEGAVLGVDVLNFPLFSEAIRQIFGRAFAAVTGNVENALALDNAVAAMLGIGELLDLLANWELLGGTDVSFPTVADAQVYASQLAEVFDRETLLPREESTVFNSLLRVRTLLEVTRQIPASAQTLFPAIERAHDELGEALSQAVLVAPSSTRVVELFQLLQAGAAYVRLGNQFSELGNTVPWEAQHLAAVVNRLGTLSEGQALWTQLDEIVRFLMDEGDRFEADASANQALATTRLASRKLYYQQAATLLARQRTVAVRLWNETDTLRKQNPDFYAADAFLPGDLRVDKIFGSVTYERTERLLTAAFGGELRLPKINSFLTIQNASINTRGDFDLNVFGQLSMPGTTNSALVVTVPKKTPWHISWRQNDGLAVSGKTRFQFENGVFFEATANLNDPLYFFELAAGTPELDTAETLAAILPLGLTADDVRNLNRVNLWNDYFVLLSACLESGYRENNDVPAPPPGSLPAFAGAVAADAYCFLDAWSFLMLAEAERGNLARYQSTYEKIGLLLELADSGFEDGSNGFEALFGANAEFEIGYHIQRLKRVSITYALTSRAIQKVGEANLLGTAPSLDPARLRTYLDHATVLWRTVRQKLGSHPTFLQDRALTAVVVRAGLDLLASYEVLGLDDAMLQLNEVQDLMIGAANAFSATAGLNRQSGQVNQALINTFTYSESRAKLQGYLDVEAELALAGAASNVSNALLDALLQQMRLRALEDIGFVADLGTFAPEATSDVRAQLGFARLLEVAATRQASGLTDLNVPAGFTAAASTLYDRFLRAAQDLPGSRWQARKGYVQSLDEIDVLLELASGTGINSPAVLEQMLAAFRVMTSEARGRLTEDEIALMRAVRGFLGDPSLRVLFNQRLSLAAAALSDLSTRAWTSGELSLGKGVLEELLVIQELLRAHAGLALTAAHQPSVLMPAADNRFIAIATQERRAQPLAEAAAVLGDAIAREAPSAFRTLLEDERKQLLDAAGEIAGNYGQQLAGLSEDGKPSDLLLPESFKVTRAFGSLFYNRTNELLRATFGGRLEFGTNNQSYFEIAQATLASDGTFGIQAATAFPLRPVGTNVLINANINAGGNRTGLTNFTGNGTMTIRELPGQVQTYQVGVSYHGGLTNRPLRFTAALDGVQNAESTRFSDDFVLFDGNIAAEFSLARLGDFSLNFGGRAGFFARTNLVEPIRKENFWVFADIDQLGIRYTNDAFVARFGGGSLTLAEDVFKLAEDLPGGDLLPTDEPVTIPLSFSFNVGYDFADGRPVFYRDEEAAGAAGTVAALSSVGLANAAAPVRFDLPPLAFGIPGVRNSAIKVNNCVLEFFEDRFPLLRELDARFVFPMPGADASNSAQDRLVDVQLTGQNWRVDGFPDAAGITLGNTVRVVDIEAFDLDLLGGSSMNFQSSIQGGQPTTTFTLSGGLRGVFDGDLLFDPENDAAFGFETTGSFTWDTRTFPQVALESVSFLARLRLGGETGFDLLGTDANGIPDTNANSLASVTLSGLTNLFQLAPSRPFEIRISGALGSAEFVYFGLRDARFLFDGVATAANTEPQFQVGSIGFREGEQLKLLGQELLPFRLTAGSLTFRSPGLPLDRLFTPTNLVFTLSGEIDISLNSADGNSTAPRLFGAVENVQVSLPSGFAGPPAFSLDTFVLLLENLSIGDMAGLTGGLAVGNLNNPAELFFAGTVGGSFNGVGIKAIVAARLDGLLGVCLAANAGPAGIPLDGGTLGGILLTGAEGGVSFLNEFADPCDFTSYLQLTPDGTPGAAPAAVGAGATPTARPLVLNRGPRVSHLSVLGWEQLAEFQARHEQEKLLRGQLTRTAPRYARQLRAAAAAAEAGADVPCPTGDCPPATLNLLCQRHPSVDEEPSDANYQGAYRDRVIFKFTSLGPEIVDEILAAANINLSGSAAVVAGNFANATRDLVNDLIARPPATLPPNQAAEINAFIDNGLDAMRQAFAVAVQAALQAAAGQGRTPLEALYEAAYAGVACADITIQLKGTFSYTPISAALSATGGAVVSTTGSAGVLGSVNLFNIPVGTGEFFYSLTDEQGNPNPSLCGGARVALGPLDLAHLNLAIGCDECVTGTLEALATFIAGLTGDIGTQTAPIIYRFVEDAAGARVPNIRSQPLTAFFGPPGSGALLNQEEQVAVMTALLNLPQVMVFLQSNPGAASEFGNQAVIALGNRIIGLVLEIYTRTNPRLAMCAEIEPKIFGFSLTGGNTLAAARVYADKTNIRGDVSFSPSYILGNLPFMIISSGSLANVVPAIDEATMGFSLGLPLVTEPTLRLLSTNPVEFASLQVDHLLANATITFGYELSPFGFKLADGEGRIVLPTVEDHPDNPQRRATRPGDYNSDGQFTAPAFPDRATLLKGALDSNVLAQATWTGRDGDLPNLFPAGSPESQALAGRELVRDFFPHGGFIGASKVQFPKPITDLPPFEQLNELFAQDTELLQRLTLAQDVFNNYILGSREVGQLMVYVPFPNPPQPFWAAAEGPQAFIDAIASTDVNALLEQGLALYPTEQFFMRGSVNAQVLGMPVGEGELIADPAAGLFRLTAGVPSNSWLRNFVGANVAFEIRSAEYILQTDPSQLPAAVTAENLQPEARLGAALDLLNAAAQSGNAAQRQAAITAAVDRITDTLPKVSLATELNLQVPPDLEGLLQFNSGAGFFAFSPRFEPGYALPGYTGAIQFADPDPANPGPYTLARRNGGVVAVGNFTFGFNLDAQDPSQRLLIDIPELALAISGAPEASAFPALAGRARVNRLNLPGAFSFNGATSTPFEFRDGLLQFNSRPDVNADYLAVSGALTPIDLGPFLRIRPLPANSNPQNLLGGDLRVTRTTSGATMAIALQPASVTVPILGSVEGIIYGTTLANGAFTPFTFSTVPGQPWQSALRLSGALEIRSPLDPTGPGTVPSRACYCRRRPSAIPGGSRRRGVRTV
ncbi:MAG: hypothetical protein AB9869_10715 [Verrucomicrobiia bacterium]